MLNRLKIGLQYALPKQAITQLAGWFAKKEAGLATQFAIKSFAKFYKVNMNEAKNSDLNSYKSFNSFFIRPLKEDARPILTDDNSLTMPADGAISQYGLINDGQIFQAKGHYYSVEALLAGRFDLADQFTHGQFITTYLSPKDYHRVHMPCDGLLTEMIYVPGDLFSVNPLTAQNVPNLFARNERLICVFETQYGTMIQILVGATIVGSIETVWSGCVNPSRSGVIQRTTYPKADQDKAIFLKKGEEMGCFKLGSTVINLFAPNQIAFNPNVSAGSATRMGEFLATGIQ